MNLSERIINDGLPQKAAIELMNQLRQEILKTARKTNKPCEILAMTYQMLSDEQKITFILGGGFPSLLQWQQHQTQQTGTDPDTETSQLPILC